MWLFIPIGIFSIVIGQKLKRSNQKYKKNFIVAGICLPLLLIFGSYRFIFDNITYDTVRISSVESKISMDIPDEIKMATIDFDLYSMSYVKILEKESQESFEEEIKGNGLWKSNLNSQIKALLPIDIQYEMQVYDFFVFYNITNGEYNNFPSEGEHECLFMAYSCKTKSIIILDRYQVVSEQ